MVADVEVAATAITTQTDTTILEVFMIFPFQKVRLAGDGGGGLLLSHPPGALSPNGWGNVKSCGKSEKGSGVLFLESEKGSGVLFVTTLTLILLPRPAARAQRRFQTKTHGCTLLPLGSAEGCAPADATPQGIQFFLAIAPIHRRHPVAGRLDRPS